MSGKGKTSKTVAKATPKDSGFKAAPKNMRIGGDIRPNKRDLSRYLRWPRYVRIQRQKKVLYQRLKVPPVLNQFTKTLDKNQASELFKLLKKYQPESKQAKAERREEIAQAKKDLTGAPVTLKFGLKHVTTLIEQKKASLVVIAHDVNPIELVVWLPALCRKMNIPFCIVKGKSRLGQLTNMKNSAVVALTSVNSEDSAALKKLQDNFMEQFNKTVMRKWGGGIMGLKTQAMLAQKAAYLALEEEKKKLSMA